MFQNRYFIYVVLTVIIFCLAASPSFTRDLLLSGGDIFLVSFLRMVFNTLFLLAVILLKKKSLSLKELRKNLFLLVIMMLTGIVGSYFLSNLGLKYVAAGKATLIKSINPALLVIFGALIFKECLTRRRVIGAVLAITGVLIVIFAGNQGLWYQLSFNPYDLIIVVSALFYASYTIANRFLGDRIDHIVGLFWVALMGTAALAPPAIPHLGEVVNFGLRQWLELLYIGMVSGAITNIVWYQSIMVIGTGNSGLINCLLPLFGVIFARLFLGETITSGLVIGAVILISGITLAVSSKSTRPLAANGSGAGAP